MSKRLRMSANFFDVDPAKTYTIKCSAKATDIKGKDDSMVYFGFQIYDKKGEILSQYVNVVDGTFTEVVADAAKGSKTFLVKDGSKYKPGAVTVVKNAKEDFSDLPNRAVICGGRITAVAQKDGAWEITMSNPLAADLKAGTLVRAHRYGGYLYVGGMRAVKGDWVELTGTISGMSKKGWSGRVWPAGTVKAKLLILSNWQNKDLSTQYKNVTMTVK